MQRKRLPIGIQTFSEIRDPKKNLAYVDKTEMAFNLIENSKYNFLSRPRRFGKSLFLDTLSDIFKGNKELFDGLYIHEKWDWSQQFPVIKIDFTVGDFSSKELTEEMIRVKLQFNCELLEIEQEKCFHENVGIYFQQLIFQTYLKYNQKVVVLIDEYDKPILDNIGKSDKTPAREARDVLRNFYGALKASDTYIEFVFITGVSKFSKLNLFSGLNNIQDITLSKHFATITGYTQKDLEEIFSEYLNDVDLDQVKRWYNGYNYFGEPIYNPFDILLFLANDCEFRNYWWGTGNPSFLIEKLKETPYFLPDLENIEVGEETLNTFDVEHIDLTALLWQTGYLTFAEKFNIMGNISYKLKVPNLEIQNSLNSLFFDYLTNHRTGSISKNINTSRSLLKNDLVAFKQELISLFASIPYENYVKNNLSNFEGYYASVIFAFLSSLGFEVKTEESTNLGRVDMTLIGPDSIFILEFKVDMEAEAALHQIESKKYYEKYTTENKQIFLIGIHFSSEERNIVGFEWKKWETED